MAFHAVLTLSISRIVKVLTAEYRADQECGEMSGECERGVDEILRAWFISYLYNAVHTHRDPICHILHRIRGKQNHNRDESCDAKYDCKRCRNNEIEKSRNFNKILVISNKFRQKPTKQRSPFMHITIER